MCESNIVLTVSASTYPHRSCRQAPAVTLATGIGTSPLPSSPHTRTGSLPWHRSGCLDINTQGGRPEYTQHTINGAATSASQCLQKKKEKGFKYYPFEEQLFFLQYFFYVFLSQCFRPPIAFNCQ